MGKMPRIWRTARYPSHAAKNPSINTRIHQAADTVIPTPVTMATYPTTHIGHLGININAAEGNIQRIPRHDRRRMPFDCPPPCRGARAGDVDASVSQNGQLLMCRSSRLL